MASLAARYDNEDLQITDAALLRTLFHVRTFILSAYVFIAQYNASLLGVESVEELLADFGEIVTENKGLLKHYRRLFESWSGIVAGQPASG